MLIGPRHGGDSDQCWCALVHYEPHSMFEDSESSPASFEALRRSEAEVFAFAIAAPFQAAAARRS